MKSAALVWATLMCFPLVAQQYPDVDKPLATSIFKELIETNTTDSIGSITTAATAMKARFLAAGFSEADVQVVGPNDRKRNLVIRYRAHAGSTEKPFLLIGHLDVVEAQRQDWNTDPFLLIEKDGYFYGRGTIDMKDSDAAMVYTFLRWKKEGFVPDRDVILALTADEEGGAYNGVSWLMQHQPELRQVAFVINPDVGGVATIQDKPFFVGVEATEKTYADYMLSATSPGGHSSEPMPGNPIYRLVHALQRLENYQFPFELNAVTRSSFTASAKIEKGQAAKDMQAILKTPPDPAAIARITASPTLNPQVRTTCVATMISGGHAPNALPGHAEVNVNCRILPGHTQEEVRQQLIHVFQDPQIRVQYKSDGGKLFDTAPNRSSAPPPPPMPAVFDPLKKVVQQMWPGTPIVPGMSVGASDSIYTMQAGIPSYGIGGMAMDMEENRAHGRDERIKVSDFYAGVEFTYLYLKLLAHPGN